MTNNTSNASDQQLSTAVIEAIADYEGVDPTELDIPLFSVINPDALNALFLTDNGSVTFEYSGHTVTVQSNGQVDVIDNSES